MVSCDVVDLRASHLLLGRLQHDMNAIYRGMMNFHVFNWCGKNMASLLNSTQPPDLKTNCKALFLRPLIEACANARTNFSQVRGND